LTFKRLRAFIAEPGLAGMSGAGSVSVGSGVGLEIVDPAPSVDQSIGPESGTNGPTIAPTIKRNAMPPHPSEVFFEATYSAYLLLPP
jgi:hypothetical protein